MRPLPCEGARELAADSLDRDLLPREADSLESHLAGCAACRAEVEGLRRVHRALEALEPAAPGSAFTEAVVARLDRGPCNPLPRRAPAGGDGPPPPPLRRALRALVPALATAVVAAAALSVLPGVAAASPLGDVLPGVRLDPLPALPAIPPFPLDPGIALAFAAMGLGALALDLGLLRRGPGDAA